MAFNREKSINSNSSSKNILKIKVIIFSILCVVAVLLLAKVYYDNTYKNSNKHSQDVTMEDLIIKKADTSESENDRKLEQKYKEAEYFFSNKQYGDTIAKADEIINEDALEQE